MVPNINPLIKIASLDANTYRNSTVVSKVGGVDFTLWDVIKTGLACRLNIGLLGGSGEGKSQLVADIAGLYGNNADRVLGRNDLDIKSLYRELNFAKLNDAMQSGGRVAQRELSNVTASIGKPLVAVEEINRCVEAVQNQFFNIFEGFIEIDGVNYSLGGERLETFSGFGGDTWQRNVRYSVGVWTANIGNGKYTGTVSMDAALKNRSHLMIDVDNFVLQGSDLDAILMGSGAEIRLKDHDGAVDNTDQFASAYAHLAQKSYTPNPQELGQELLLFRYLVLGLDYVPSESGNNSKRAMKEVWPSIAEEKNFGKDDDDKLMYRVVSPASVRTAMTVVSFARGLREYAKAKDDKANPKVLESVTESFKIVGAYSGMLNNSSRVREFHVGNPYLAATEVATAIQTRLEARQDLMTAIVHFQSEGTAFPRKVLDECKGEYACFIS
ncbi:AAA domain-containing protein [archaeon]|nr:AAA domain-containing protein [archaeon]MBT6762329.1 AAA domain-containing protein [archaeon]